MIKFRGKTISGEWVYGYLSILEKKFNGVEPGCYISNPAGAPFAYQVRPETVSQLFIHIPERNLELYGNDVVEIFGINHLVQYKIHLNTIPGQGDCVAVCTWGVRLSAWGNRLADVQENIKLVGNLIDNPDLKVNV